MTQPDVGFPAMPDLLRRLGIRPERHRSQHFLAHQHISAAVADAAMLSREHAVLEIGAGLGNLTVELAARAGSVQAIEMDTTFVDWHRTLAALHPGITFHYSDVLALDLAQTMRAATPLDGPRVAVGNLPYQVTAPILFALVGGKVEWQRLVLMVQLEVAERLAAGVPSREASALTYRIALGWRAEIVMALGPEEFIPPPRVNSAVVRLEPLDKPAWRDLAHRDRLFHLIGEIFQHRRRTLANGLQLGGAVPTRADAEVVLRAAGIDPMRRAETLAIDEIVALEAALATR